MTDSTGLLDQWGDALPLSSHFRKGAPPKTDTQFGRWAGRDMRFIQLPGGATLQFDLSRLTLADYRSMRDHYQINNSLTLLQFMLHQIDWRIECADKKIADALEETLGHVWTQLVRSMSQAFWAGFSPIVTEYSNNLNTMRVEISRFKDLVPEECTVNWREVDGWAPPGRTPPKLYEYDGVKQYGLVDPIPAENTLWYPMMMENGDYYGRKLLRSAFPSWFFSQLIHLFTNRYFERFGEPLPVGRADFTSEIDMGDTQVSGRVAMENILTQIRNRSVVVLPSDRDPETKEYDYDIQYLESQMRGADFDSYLDRLDEEMSMALFTPILLMRTGKTGAYNLGVAHLQTWLWCLNALAADMKDYIDSFVVDRLKNYNFGPNAPKAYWSPRGLGRDSTDVLRSLVTALVGNEMAIPDLEALGDAVGIKFNKYSPPPPPVDPNAPPPGPAKVTDTRTRVRPSKKTQQPGA